MSDLVAETPEKPGTPALRVAVTLGGIVLAAVVIFALGVMEGSRVAEVVPAADFPPSALPTETLKPLPSAAAGAAAQTPPDELTFYDRLSGVAPAAPAAVPEAQPPQEAAPATAGATTPQPQAPAPKPAATPAPRKTANASAPPAAGAAARTAAKADPAVQIRKLSGKGRYTLQMAAVAERSSAEKTAAMIKRNGFDATTVMASVKGKIWYRIRTGSFPSKRAAAQAAGIFRSAYGLNAIPVEN